MRERKEEFFSFTLEHEAAFNTNLIVNFSIGGAFLGAIVIVNFVGKK